MFILKKILLHCFIPSTLILGLLVGGILLLFIFNKKRSGKYLIIIGALFYYMFSITPVSDFLLWSLESKYPPIINIKDIKDTNTIVVLSGTVKANQAYPITSQLSESAVSRILEAFRLYLFLDNPNVIISGGSGNPFFQDIKASRVMANLASFIGMPESHIVCEGNSRDTYESAKEVQKILKDKSFLLLTSAFHLPRAMAVFHKLGMQPIPAPADSKVTNGRYSVFDFFPEPVQLQKSCLAIHEYMGIAWYYINGYV